MIVLFLEENYKKNNMAGHSHWAGIKHKKDKTDKNRSKIFSKLSREITVAAKIGDKDPNINPRLRSAIQSARSANMPKENILRAIEKSQNINVSNYESIRYEGFGPNNIACIIETLTDNKNRTASNLRTIFQKNDGSLGTQGSASHNFKQIGVIKFEKSQISEELFLEKALDVGAEDYLIKNNYYEIQCKKSQIYKVKKELEKKIENFISTEIEWLPFTTVPIGNINLEKYSKFIQSLDDDDDVQKVYTNLDNLK